ncbi:hypothetical protein CT694_15725 [Bacillus wiedmannii bv. thuringiensis]|nr:hypothetical protein CT694_15725 [Bacillus wiedmannii bv. thuringiensis]
MTKTEETKKALIKACTPPYNKEAAKGGFYRVCQNLDYYQYIKGYKAEMSYLYGIIANYYSPSKGYAYPTQYQLLARYHKSPTTLRSHIAKLVNVGLLTVMKNSIGDNNCYIPHVPLEKEQLFELCPDAKADYEKKMAWIQARETDDRRRLTELNESIRGQQKKHEAERQKKLESAYSDELEDVTF